MSLTYEIKKVHESVDKIFELRERVAAEFGIEEFTCDSCGIRYSCTYSYDAYNTNGDCLAEK